MLVNNAGTGWIGRFDRQSAGDHSRLIRLHCEMHVELTARLLPAMKQRRRGAVVLVASVGGIVPLPYYAVYGGTKALLANWGEALAVEMRDPASTFWCLRRATRRPASRRSPAKCPPAGRA